MMAMRVLSWVRGKGYSLIIIILILITQFIIGAFAMGSTNTATTQEQVTPPETISPLADPYVREAKLISPSIAVKPSSDISVTIQNPTTQLCVSTDPSTYIMTYKASIVGGNGYTIQWYMDDTAQSGQNSPTFTYNWYANAKWGTHVVSVALLDSAGVQVAMDSKTITAYPQPAIGNIEVTVA